jgi:hypothetical protein
VKEFGGRQYAAMLVTIASFGCTEPTSVCAGLERAAPTLPDTTTIKVGTSDIVVAGQGYGICLGEPEHPPPRAYWWNTSDSTVVAVTPIDSIRARITGLRTGKATVTPEYRAGGDRLSSVDVTVVP